MRLFKSTILPFSQRNACETEPLHAKDWPTIWFVELMLKPALQSSPPTVPISVSTPFFQRNPCTAELSAVPAPPVTAPASLIEFASPNVPPNVPKSINSPLLQRK